MALFALSDTHLSSKVNKPMSIFGARWTDHQNKIAESWIQTVTNEDTVVIPGDISWGIDFEEAIDDLKFLDDLPGTKIIMKGNHDYWWNTVSKMTAFFDKESIRTVSILFNNAYEVGGYVICGTRGWYPDVKTPSDADYNKIVNREVGRLKMSIFEGKRFDSGKERIVFMHFPPVFGDYVCRELIDVLHANNIGSCFFGHIHGVYDIPPEFTYEDIRFRIVSADYLNFKPILIND